MFVIWFSNLSWETTFSGFSSTLKLNFNIGEKFWVLIAFAVIDLIEKHGTQKQATSRW